MSRNVGTVERAVRIFIGVVLIALGLFHVFGGTLAIAGYVVGAIALVTGFVRYCPAWAAFGVNTCTTDRPR
jgi:uncharacterized membrane protein HdeD (DUF308 family)